MMSNWHWHWHCQWSILGTVRSRTTHLARNREGDQLQVFRCASISSTLHFRSSILSASLSPHKASDMALWWPTWWPIWRWTRWLTWESNLVRELITGVNWAQTFLTRSNTRHLLLLCEFIFHSRLNKFWKLYCCVSCFVFELVCNLAQGSLLFRNLQTSTFASQDKNSSRRLFFLLQVTSAK